ncbi:hypothetical protein GW931_03035 [archaeon]|nr:hypothetical protein [archaeon]PJC45342.1 MAG: hypothetical protein CO037_01985 [Candidatus Pacearchaeota archaeon CG_4_9_14_0_2_um_filter_30_8]
MVEKARCEKCDRTFKDLDGLAAHNRAKHPEKVVKKKEPLPLKKIRNWGIFIVILGVVIFGLTNLIVSYSNSKTIIDSSKLNFTAPTEPIHWHPQLTIIIDGQKQNIPSDIGLGGSTHMPIHTHDDSGTIHMEEDNPTKESVTVGYFFNVWGKKFSKDCIFEYCSDKGNLIFTVNGEKNYDFQEYFMQEEDNLLIEYTSF